MSEELKQLNWPTQDWGPTVEVVRSFSQKVNTGNYTSQDHFASVKLACPLSRAVETSEMLYDFAYAEVQRSIEQNKSGKPPVKEKSSTDSSNKAFREQAAKNNAHEAAETNHEKQVAALAHGLRNSSSDAGETQDAFVKVHGPDATPESVAAMKKANDERIAVAQVETASRREAQKPGAVETTSGDAQSWASPNAGKVQTGPPAEAPHEEKDPGAAQGEIAPAPPAKRKRQGKTVDPAPEALAINPDGSPWVPERTMTSQPPLVPSTYVATDADVPTAAEVAAIPVKERGAEPTEVPMSQYGRLVELSTALAEYGNVTIGTAKKAIRSFRVSFTGKDEDFHEDPENEPMLLLLSGIIDLVKVGDSEAVLILSSPVRTGEIVKAGHAQLEKFMAKAGYAPELRDKVRMLAASRYPCDGGFALIKELQNSPDPETTMSAFERMP